MNSLKFEPDICFMNSQRWALTARCYERFRAFFPFNLILKAENRQLQALLESIELAGKIVIDLGTGTGNALQLCKPDALAIGIDANLTMLQFARMHRPNSFFIQAEVSSLPIKSGLANLILVVGLSEYLYDLDALFKEIARISSNKGWCIFTYSPKTVMTHLRTLLGHKIYPRRLDDIVRIALLWKFEIKKQGRSWMQRQILLQKTAPTALRPYELYDQKK